MTPPLQGRPSATDHAAIERAAFELFARQGFEDTTMEDIARQVGVGRRTLFRYFPSKNDIPWGQFRQSLAEFRDIFAAMPADVPVWDAIGQGLLAFNDFPEETLPVHRQRMELILTTPDLQAHSVHQYTEWRRVIAEFVAARTGDQVGDLVPTLAGHISLAVAVTAYERWLLDDTSDLRHLLQEATNRLQDMVGM